METNKALEIVIAYRSEVQAFNSRVDRACAIAFNLDMMIQESFTKLILKEICNDTPSCSGRESGNPEDGLKSQGRIWKYLKSPGRKIRVPKKKTKQTSPSFRYRIKKFFGFI